VAKAISPRPDLLAEERREHLHLFNLLGDPLLRLPAPAEVPLTVAADVDAGGRLTIEGVSPVAGRMIVELSCRRDRLTFTPPPRTELPPVAEALVRLDEVYQRANDHRWTSQYLDVVPGAFHTTLDVPTEAQGHAHVRVFLEGADACALGAADVYVRRPRPMAAE
jgi:hypothetical protein